jgi:DNA-binding ferritin-like protein
MAAQSQAEPVNIMTLGPQQLNMLREQLSQEVDDLAENHTLLGRLALRSSNAARAVETLGESKTGRRKASAANAEQCTAKHGKAHA